MNYLFECWNASIFSCEPAGYVLEKQFDLGSIGLRGTLILPSPSANADAIEQLSGVEKIQIPFTWPKYTDVVRTFVDDLKGDMIGEHATTMSAARWISKEQHDT